MYAEQSLGGRGREEIIIISLHSVRVLLRNGPTWFLSKNWIPPFYGDESFCNIYIYICTSEAIWDFNKTVWRHVYCLLNHLYASTVIGYSGKRYTHKQIVSRICVYLIIIRPDRAGNEFCIHTDHSASRDLSSLRRGIEWHLC